MSYNKIKQKREEQKRILEEQVELVIRNSNCVINRLEISEHFGNVIVELKNESCILRFIQDRGDIYFEKELFNRAIRPEQQLIFTHNEFAGENYTALIKAIELKMIASRNELHMDYEYYQKAFENPSESYQKFVREYITERAMIAGRGEEYAAVWDELQGEELETAKIFILKHLEENPKMPYIRAAGIFRDNRALPILEMIINTFPERFLFEKLYAAKILHDWKGYDKYIEMLESACLNDNEQNRSYLRFSLGTFTDGLDTDEKNRVYTLLNV